MLNYGYLGKYFTFGKKNKLQHTTVFILLFRLVSFRNIINRKTGSIETTLLELIEDNKIVHAKNLD